jgi:acyl-CoA synthetase (NDP forming)
MIGIKMTNSFRQVVDQANREGRVYLMEHEVKAILEGQGISSTRSLVARSEDEAVKLFQSTVSPVALKILSPEVIHKSDAGGVKLNLQNEDQVREAYRQIINSFRDKTVTGVSVQEMAKPGVEVIIGVTSDPTFGPVMMFGLGGIFVEILKDVSFRSIPLSESDAEDMIEEIKGYALLKGYRGSKADVPALRDLLLKISDLVMENPEIKEMDLNPVFVYPEGYKVVDARIILGEPMQRASQALPKQDLHELFYPKSIAVIGASGTKGKLGWNVFTNLVCHNF